MNRPAPLAGPTAARGVVIIAAAVVLGAVLLARGGHGSLLDRATSHPKSSTTVQADFPSTTNETTTAVPTTNPPSQVKVAIFNGTGGALPNAAGDNQRKLTPHGYTQVSINDTTATGTSVIYYAPGAQGDAAAIAALLGLPAKTPVPLSQAASVPAGAGGAQVIVVVGADAAGTSSTAAN